VEGWPVGPEHSFVRVALQSISSDDTFPAILSYVNLRSAADRIAESCRGNPPDYLVLQLGHYETSPLFSKILGKLLFTSSHAKHQPRAETQTANDAQDYRPKFVSRWITLRRWLIAILFVLLGQRRKIFDPDALSSMLDSTLYSLKALPFHSIFVISPFSAPDPIIRMCRRRAHRIFFDIAQKHGCIFVDAFASLESQPKGVTFQSAFCDSFHLSRCGHERVGRLLGDSLRSVISGYSAGPGGTQFASSTPTRICPPPDESQDHEPIDLPGDGHWTKGWALTLATPQAAAAKSRSVPIAQQESSC